MAFKEGISRRRFIQGGAAFAGVLARGPEPPGGRQTE
jgi:hypothetical protein